MLRTVLVLTLLLGCVAPVKPPIEATVSEEYDENDIHSDFRPSTKAPSGGVSAGVDLVTGQAEPSMGPQAWFKDDNGVPDAKAYTVRFATQPPNPPSGNPGFFDCVATVTSTVQGNAITRQMNVNQGAVITGEAESVNVNLQDITPQSGQPFGLPYRVTVIIAPGIRPNYTIPPTLEAFTDFVNGAPFVTSGTIVLNAGQGANYPVPPQAGVGSVEVLAADPASPAGTVSAIVSMFSVLGTTKTYDPRSDHGFIALAPNTTIVEVTNHGPTPIEVTVTFGIEG